MSSILAYIESIENEQIKAQEALKKTDTVDLRKNSIYDNSGDAKRIALLSILKKIYSKSIPTDVVDTNIVDVDAKVDEYLSRETEDPLLYVKEGIAKTNSPKLIRIMETVENKVKEKTVEMIRNVDNITMQDTIPKESDYDDISDLIDMDIDTISGIVEKNVINDINAEKSKALKIDALKEKIQNTVKEELPEGTPEEIEARVEAYNDKLRGESLSLFEAVLCENFSKYDDDTAYTNAVCEYTFLNMIRGLNLNYTDIYSQKELRDSYIK